MRKRGLVATAAIAVVATSLLFGAAVAANPLVLIVIPALALLVVVLSGDDRWAIGLIFLLRTFSDTALLDDGGGFLVNVAISGLAVLLLGRYLFLERIPMGRIAIATLVFVATFTLVGIGVNGVESSMLNDSLRIFSIVSIGSAAAAAVAKRGGRSIANVIILAAIPAAVLTFAGWVFQVPGFYSDVTGRGFGTLTHPVAAAAFFSIVAVLALYAALHYGMYWHLGSLGIFTLAVIATSSLGGLVTIAFGLVVLLVLLERRTRGRLAAFVFVALGGLVSLSFFGTTIFSRLDELGATNSADQSAGGENSLDWRFRNWEALLKFWEEQPVTGWGYGSTSDLIRPLGELPHSGPVQLLVETGVLGLVFAFGIVVAAVVVIVRMWRAGERNPAALRATVLGTILVNSLSANTLGYMPMLMAFSVVWAVAQPSSERLTAIKGIGGHSLDGVATVNSTAQGLTAHRTELTSDRT